MTLIKSTNIIYSVEISEADIRAALITEALERHGLLHDGKPVPGCTTTVSYDGRRNSRSGLYTVRIERDLSKSGQAQLPKPEIAP